MKRLFSEQTNTVARVVFFTVFALAVGFGSAPLHAASANAPLQPRNDVETRITADKLTYQAEKQQVVFEGNVHVVRPDFELTSSRLNVHMKPPKSGNKEAKQGSAPAGLAAGDVERLVAIGSVVMKEPEQGRTGTCDKATYTTDDGVLLMEGNPRLTDGDNTVTGETIRYFTQQNRSEVVGGKKRVEAVFSGNKKGNR